MADAKKLPSGSWRALLYVGKDENGKRIYESFTAPTKKEANYLASERARELEQGIRNDRSPQEMTVGEAIDKYISERDAILAPKTIREYKGYRKNYIQGLMRVKIKDLSESLVQREINKESRRLSPKSIRNIWALFNSSIHSAVPNMYFNINLPQKEKKEFHIPTQDQLLRLFEEVEGKRLEIPVILAATCGLRRGEIAALDFDKDIDYKNNTVTVNKAMSNNDKSEWVIKSPKAYSSYRTVEAPEWVIEKIKSARENDYHNMNPAHITSAFARVCNKLNIKIRFHDLRHYYASLMLSLGVPDKYAMARMGHATPNMLKTVYQHIMSDKEKEFSDIINKHFEMMQHENQQTKIMQHDAQHTTNVNSDENPNRSNK